MLTTFTLQIVESGVAANVWSSLYFIRRFLPLRELPCGARMVKFALLQEPSVRWDVGYHSIPVRQSSCFLAVGRSLTRVVPCTQEDDRTVATRPASVDDLSFVVWAALFNMSALNVRTRDRGGGVLSMARGPSHEHRRSLDSALALC